MTKAEELTQLVKFLIESISVISMGDHVKVNMSKVKAHDNAPAYIKLINSIIKKAKPDAPIVISVNNDYAEIAADKFDALMGTARVPLTALTLVEMMKV